MRLPGANTFGCPGSSENPCIRLFMMMPVPGIATADPNGANTLWMNEHTLPAPSATTNDVVSVFHKAVENIRPHVEPKPRRVGGATYQIPIEVRHDRSLSLALRWLRAAARNRRGSPMQKRLADELLAAYKGEGAAVKKREETHKMAEANRAFAHYRW